ncbi:MAG: IS200/IS605 family transposase [Bacteroidales bacterium]|nr:IS200/IS605 family transposase [Bacteroidales bacterium]
MLHSHTKIFIHLIWATKNRKRLFKNEFRKELSFHLIEKAKFESIPFISLNVQPEHVHGLINLPSDRCLAEFMQKIKGESSFWINQNKNFLKQFNWQRGYGGYSVSASQLEKVKKYIQNQDEHHRKKSFDEEYEEWKREYGIFDD